MQLSKKKHRSKSDHHSIQRKKKKSQTARSSGHKASAPRAEPTWWQPPTEIKECGQNHQLNERLNRQTSEVQMSQWRDKK